MQKKIDDVLNPGNKVKQLVSWFDEKKKELLARI
jgi:hypothetical protein